MKKYGLQIRAPPQKKQPSSRPPLPSIFDEEEDNDIEKEISRQASKTKALKKIEEQHKKALEEDPNAFAYDDVYDDDMKHKPIVPKMQYQQDPKSRYVEHLMKKAEHRQKEREIAYDRKLAKEREKDEHLFSGKESFITGAYKKKLEKQKKWLAEERLRELREESDDVTKKKDLRDFYINIKKNVAFGARHIQDKDAEKLEEQRKEEELRKEETREESPEKEVSPESRDIGSSRKEPQDASEKKIGSDVTEEKDSSIEEAAKEAPKATIHHKKGEDAISAARERFLSRKKAKMEE